jgi:hypothetical protein
MVKKYYSDTIKCENPNCDNFVVRYGKKLSKTCGNTECIIYVRKKTNLEKYGNVNNLHSKVGKEKVLATLKEKYGSEITNVSQIESVKQKKKDTCLKNFGVEWPMQSGEILDKSKNTCIEKYGVDNCSKSEVVIEKIRNNLYIIDEKTGLTKIELINLKTRNVCLERYGKEYYFETEQFKEHLKSHILEKYGEDNIFKTEFFKALMKEKGFHRSDDADLSLWVDYTAKVRRLTEITFRKYVEILCVESQRGKEFHLDHIFSIYEGYRQGVEAEVMASIVNLQMIPAETNHRKNRKCWIDKEQLLENYQKLLKEEKNEQ